MKYIKKISLIFYFLIMMNYVFSSSFSSFFPLVSIKYPYNIDLIFKLPREIEEHILYFTDSHTLVNIKKTNKTGYKLVDFFCQREPERIIYFLNNHEFLSKKIKKRFKKKEYLDRWIPSKELDHRYTLSRSLQVSVGPLNTLSWIFLCGFRLQDNLKKIKYETYEEMSKKIITEYITPYQKLITENNFKQQEFFASTTFQRVVGSMQCYYVDVKHEEKIIPVRIIKLPRCFWQNRESDGCLSWYSSDDQNYYFNTYTKDLKCFNNYLKKLQDIFPDSVLDSNQEIEKNNYGFDIKLLLSRELIAAFSLHFNFDYVSLYNTSRDTFMLPYIAKSSTLFFCNFYMNNIAFVTSVQDNKNLKKLHIKIIHDNNEKFNEKFIDLSPCNGLTDLVVENVYKIQNNKYINHKKFSFEHITHIKNLTSLELGRHIYYENMLKDIANCKNLKNLSIATPLKYKYLLDKDSYTEENKKKNIQMIEIFNKMKLLENLTILDDPLYFSNACYLYYNTYKKLPKALELYLKLVIQKHWDYYIDIPNELCYEWPGGVYHPSRKSKVVNLSKEYDCLILKHDSESAGKTVQGIHLKEIFQQSSESGKQFCDFINNSTYFTVIYVDNKNSESFLNMLCNANVDHKKIKGIIIKAEKSNILIDSEYLQKYEDLYLSIEVDKHYNIELKGEEFSTITILRTNLKDFLLKPMSMFPSLKEFAFTDPDECFKNHEWEKERLPNLYHKDVLPIVFDALKDFSVLYWYRNSEDRRYSIPHLEPCYKLMEVLFKNYNRANKEKIKKRLKKLDLGVHLKSLELFFKFSYDQFPESLQGLLKSYAKIQNETSWQEVQPIYLEATEEEIASQSMFSSALILDSDESFINKTTDYVNLFFNTEKNEEKRIKQSKECRHFVLKTYALFTTGLIFLLLYPKSRMYILEKIKNTLNIDLFGAAEK